MAKRYVIAALVTFVFIFLFEWLIHGVLLGGMYEKTASVWRTSEDLMAMIPLGICWQFILAALSALIFLKYGNTGLREGVIFGLTWGTIAAMIQSAMYLYLPIPFALAGLWFVVSVCEGIGIGVILSSIFQKSDFKAHR